ncbi:MAG: NTF2 fold immunity protein [Victivallaceae bacterium]
MKKLLFIVFVCSLSSGVIYAAEDNLLKETIEKKVEQNQVNLKLNEKTALKLAETILIYIYGEEVLSQKPWIVTDNADNYKIIGTFHGLGKGGVAEIIISKSDARVLSIIHGK